MIKGPQKIWIVLVDSISVIFAEFSLSSILITWDKYFYIKPTVHQNSKKKTWSLCPSLGKIFIFNGTLELNALVDFLMKPHNLGEERNPIICMYVCVCVL